jgi:hypothetical protein
LLCQLCIRFPSLGKRALLKGVTDQLPAGADAKDWTPRYAQWEQRVPTVTPKP